MKKVIDLSSHNQIPYDWTAVKYYVDGAILRCGYRGYSAKGSLVEDKRFRQFQRACEQFNIPYGVYFFPTSVSIAESVEEADFVLPDRHADLFLDVLMQKNKGKKLLLHIHSTQ